MCGNRLNRGAAKLSDTCPLAPAGASLRLRQQFAVPRELKSHGRSLRLSAGTVERAAGRRLTIQLEAPAGDADA